MSETADDALIQQVLSGDNRDLQVMAAQGMLPVPPDVLIPLQISLVKVGDEEVSQIAAAAIRSHDAEIVSKLLEHEEDEEVLAYCGLNLKHATIVETILRRRDLSRDLLAEMARVIDADMQEILLVRQDAIVECPGILDALEDNPELSRYSRRRILEYREHLIPRAGTVGPPPPQLQEIEDISYDELEEAIEKVREKEPALGERDKLTGLTDSQIKALPIPARVKLTRGASRSLRNILIKDPNPMVCMSVIYNSPLSEAEIELIAGSRTVIDDVLVAIGRNRSWMRKYNIMHNMIRNPRAPIAMTMKLVPHMQMRDLRNLTRDRNIPNALRVLSQRLYRKKMQ